MKLKDTNTDICGASFAKYLLWETADGGFVESSILYLPTRKVRFVFCFPSSIGCAMDCKICAMPYCENPRLLTADEFWTIAEKSLETFPIFGKYQVSFMGQGEPLLNPDNVFSFCDALMTGNPRATIGISTIGIACAISRLSRFSWAPRVKLQVSLHAWPSSVRQILIPEEKQYPVEKAIYEARHFAMLYGTKVCLNVVLIDGLNDSPDHARSVAAVAKSGPFYVKLSTFNPYEDSEYKPSTTATTKKFHDLLVSEGVDVKRFTSIGSGIHAGCGQTALRNHLPCQCCSKAQFYNDLQSQDS